MASRIVHPSRRIAGHAQDLAEAPRETAVAATPKVAERDDLARFFGLSEDLLCVAGFDGHFRKLSPSWSSLLGFTIEELMAGPFEQFVHPDDRDRTSAQFAAQVALGATGIQFVNRYRHKDGSYRTLSWNAAPDVELGLVYAVARCIDPQIEAERAVRKSEGLFRSAFDDALVGMCLTTPAGYFQRVNSTLAMMLGRTVDELVGMHYSDVTHHDDLGRNAADVKSVLSGAITGFQDEKRYLRPDGTVVITMMSTSLVRDPTGEPSHFVTQMLDVTQNRAAVAKLAATAGMLDAIVQNNQSLVYVKDLDGRYLLANKPFLDAFGVSESDLIGRDDTWLNPDREPVWRVNDFRAREGAYRLQEWSGHDEARRAYESVKFPLYDGAGQLYAICGVSLEVTELHAQREEASRAAEFSAAVLNASPDAIVIDDVVACRTVYASPHAAALFGTTADEASGPLGSEAATAEDRNRLSEALTAATGLSDAGIVQVRYRTIDTAGGEKWLSRRMTPFRRDSQGGLQEVLSVVRDVSEIVAAEDELKHRALHDPLTGLPNRTLLMDRLNGALLRAHRQQSEVAVMFCDLDGFKRVNDVGGHAVGDEALMQVAQRMRDALRAHDTVARVGGDEFVVILEPLDPGAAADPARTARQHGEDVARRLIAALEVPIVVAGAHHSVTASIGLTFAKGTPSGTAEDVISDADAAMYQAKAAGKNRYQVWETSGLPAADVVDATEAPR